VTGLCCELLQKRGIRIASERSATHWSGIIAADVGRRDPKDVQTECLKQNVVVNCRGGMLRISPHVYTSVDDVERLASAVGSG
jgi:cysteine desulfurase / selenocysteine lyase